MTQEVSVCRVLDAKLPSKLKCQRFFANKFESIFLHDGNAPHKKADPSRQDAGLMAQIRHKTHENFACFV